MNPTITIGIPTHKRPDFLQWTLSEICREMHPSVLEILIADQSAEKAKDSPFNKKGPVPIIYFSLSKNNLPAARNQIIQRAKGQIVLFLDDDVLPGPDLVSHHLAAYQDPKVMGVAGQVFERTDGQRAKEAGSIFRPADFEKALLDPPEMQEPENRWMVGCNFSVRKEAALQINGFDEQMISPSLGEDNDFSERLKKGFSGNRIAFSEQAFVYHLKAESGGVRSYDPLGWQATFSRHLFIFRHLKGRRFLMEMVYSLKERSRNASIPCIYWLHPLFWWNFYRSVVRAYQRKDELVSSISDNKAE